MTADKANDTPGEVGQPRSSAARDVDRSMTACVGRRGPDQSIDHLSYPDEIDDLLPAAQLKCLACSRSVEPLRDNTVDVPMPVNIREPDNGCPEPRCFTKTATERLRCHLARAIQGRWKKWMAFINGKSDRWSIDLTSRSEEHAPDILLNRRPQHVECTNDIG
jgi:hypothetical protein